MLSVFPAPAGINRDPGVPFVARGSVPRASGDKPQIVKAKTPQRMCSPRQRG
ncbi:hypothetical protein ECDEC13B_2849 [Escherichia coli DEC13B]|nr:hypothetical protein ECDEC13A_3003 [Escherichia coli DEC13A]EHX58946.1 hypothetical protein ECDEC13B_2849 [Escherichia coli DEC13B]EHX59634.1 hypothetical protein ECDEC13C_3347 [Escherichia coli DEC13C]EHX62010.1 hypothetical protein ECDEC13D_3160 [Escherichia coli DEC13D]EHX71945.1 hypothetical protein ECDEC13E_3192 [Escherichia coli DEC13E]